MKRISLIFAAALALAGLSAKAEEDTLTMDKFAYTNKLMVAGYTGTETLQNFPVLVRLAEYDESTRKGIPGFRYANLTNSKGADIAFFDANGNHLASEIQTNDWTTSGESLVWVKLPQMTQGTRFYMCYNTTASGAWVTNENPWGDYVGVWHLDETGGSGTTIYDSTTNCMNGLSYAGGRNGSDKGGGAVGHARRIAEDNNHAWGIVVDATNGVKKTIAEQLGSDFHASFWMLTQADSFATLNWGNIIGRRKGDMGRSWGFQFHGDGNDSSQVKYMRVHSNNDNSGNVLMRKTIGNWLKLNDGVWKKVDVVWRYNSNNEVPVANVYTNGVHVEEVSIRQVTNEVANIGIGCSTQDNPTNNKPKNEQKGRRFNGSMDEVRLRPGVSHLHLSSREEAGEKVVDSDWIKAEFETVNNEQFVTIAPPDVLEVTWAESSGMTGVTNVTWGTAVVGGIVTSLDENATGCTIEGKFWVGDAEPAGWTTLANGLGELDAFEIAVPCQANTVYNYKLRGVDDNGETEPVTGTFTTPVGLAVTWAVTSRTGVTNVLSHIAVVGGTIDTLDSAPSITIEGKFWNGDETEPAEWTVLGEALSQTGDFSFSISGLEIDHLYSYKLQAKGSNGIVVSPASGTFMTGHGLVIQWAGTQEQPGVTNIAWNAVIVGGAVESVGDDPSCSLEGKFWVDGETEPTGWQTLGAGNFDLGDFSVSVPNLVENTTYRYKLRATETDGSETPAVAGTFTTPVGLSATWAGTAGVTNVLCYSAVIGGALDCLGNSATCTIEGKFWVGETEPTEWTVLGEALSQTGDFSVAVSNLTAGTTYNCKLRALGANGVATTPVSDSFMTLQGLTINWAADSGKTGLSQIAYDFVSIGGAVQHLGEATSCAVQYKIWSGDELDDWETLSSGLGLSQNFNSVVNGFEAGTTYNYKLRALGNDGMPSEIVSGVFTTKGEEGEKIGSDDTEFFDDGTNACWVVKGFERYLPFTVTGYTGSETLTNFPVLVEIRKADTNGFKYEDFYHYDGSDMAFVDEKGHIIPHEIDTWNKSGMSLIWVRLPEMVNGTKFTMCYRSPLLTPLPDVGNTFEKYVGVWHMNETQNGVASIQDSTVNNLSGESHAKSLVDNNGRIGKARRVAQETGTSSSNGRIMVYDHDDILRTSVGNVFTFSGWYKAADKTPNWAYLVSRKGDDYSRGWGIQFTDKNATDQLRVWSDPLGSKLLHSDSNPGGYYHFGIGRYHTGDNTGYNHNAWAYWTFVFSNDTFHAYYNGKELNSTRDGFTLEQPFANDGTADYDFLVIGGMEFGTGAFNGTVDEARYSKGIRSDDWIMAEYISTMQAQWWNDAAKRFVTKGTVSIGNDSPVPVVVWEKGANLPVSIIDVSYAYVQFAGTVTYCGAGSDDCRVEYQIWADGEEDPTIDGVWTPLGNLTNVTAGTSFSIPVTGLKQDMPYNFRIRAVNTLESGEAQANREQTGSFRTLGNVAGSGEGELLRIDNRFIHRYRAGSYTFTTPDYVTSVEILVVGGGGAGGYKIGGGGGGGGLFYSASFPVETNTTYRIQVGEGGSAATDLEARGENGQLSYFARKDGDGEDDETILISVPGGGAGGSPAFVTVNKTQVAVTNIAAGADGGSGGGGSFALAGGQPVSNEVDGVWVTYGYEGGQGNDNKPNGNQQGKTAAGGGGGAAREGVTASFDGWYGGGAGGAGLVNSMTGERLFYGAGGGGGYAYRTDGSNYSKPGAGGSGIGGNAADVRNGTPATSGVENTGAGGGGGSMILNNNDDKTYWQGGDGGDGIVLIAYEVHGRDPLAEEPRISMTRCEYNPDAGTTGRGEATIDYRAFWAGIQAQENDIYVLYSTVSEEDVAAGNGERAKVLESSIGIGTTTFVPPEVGHTYWIRLMSRKDESSFMYSDEVASFYVPAVTLNGATWNNNGSAKVLYKLHDLSPETHLYCYWSESRELLEGDTVPTGDGVHYLDLGTGMATENNFTIAASEGLDRSKVYYIRLVCGDAGGWKRFLSDEIAELKDAPTVILSAASWANQVATVEFTAKTMYLAPEDVQLFVFYSTVSNDVNNAKVNNKTWPYEKGAPNMSLGTFAELPEDVSSSISFPLSSDVATNYYVRLGLYSTASNTWWCSDANTVKEISVSATTPNTLYIFATANAKKGAYGDAPQALDYEVSYGGLTNGVGFTYFTNNVSISGALACEVDNTKVPGIYDITQGTLALSGPVSYHVAEEVDPSTEEVISEAVDYYCVLAFVGAKYMVTNAVFSVAIPDVVTNYTGEAIETGGISPVVTGVRNNQLVTFLYRVGDGDWADTISTSYSETWTHTVQFKATAANHEPAVGTFMITINPAPLYAEISAANRSYTGVAQSPVITTNVTGHVKPELNPLTCEFRDEAGEWQSEVPAFTQPGEYKLYFRVSARNHATFTTNCTFTIEGWDYKVNMDGKEGYKTEINVSDPGWLLRSTGETSEHFADRDDRYANLDRVCDNGLKLWQNYVIDRQDLSKKLVATIMQRGSRVNKDSFVVHFPNVEALRNTGLNIRFRLDKKLKGESTFTQGALSDKYNMNVPLGFEDGNDSTGLYVFNMVLVSTNETAETGAGEAVLASCATVGVMRVSSTNMNTVTAVPWHSMSVDTETPTNIVANDVVNQNGISTDDMILAYKAASGKFNAWSNGGESGWKALATVTTNGVDVIDADDAQFPRGNAFWLVRSNPSTKYYYLIGRYTGDNYEVELAGGTAENPGNTLVANPTTDDVALNDLVFVDGEDNTATPADGDRIIFQDASGYQTIYSPHATTKKWGRIVPTKVGRRVQNVWTEDGTNTMGTGFWYMRTDQSKLLKIKFGGAR